jgi:hypothetical protein
LFANKTGPTRLGFAILLKFFAREARFPYAKNDVPPDVIRYLAKQVAVPDAIAQYLQYDWRGRSIMYHRAQIREFFGFREATVANGQALTEWLTAAQVPYDYNLDALKVAAYGRLRELKLEPPTPARLDRLVRAAIHAYEQQLFATVLQRLPDGAQKALQVLIDPPPAGTAASDDDPAQAGHTYWHTIKADPGRPGLESLLKETAKLLRLRQLDLPADLFAGVAPRVLVYYRQRAAVEPVRELRRHQPGPRYTLLAAYCWLRQQELTDSLVDLLISIIHRINARAEHKVEQEWVADLRRVEGKTNLLYRLADAAVQNPDGIVKFAWSTSTR